MKRLFYLTAIVGITLASCTKPGNGTKVAKTYPVSVLVQQRSNNTDDTRVENIEGIDHWSVGDKIGIYVFSEGAADGALNYPYGEGYAGDLFVDYNANDLISGFGTFLNNSGFSHSIIANFAMTGLHEEPVPTADFQGTLTYEQISQLDPNSLYDYFSYYPYINAGGELVLILSLVLPESEITVQKNVFPAHTVRLMGTVHINSSPITWLNENEEQQWGDKKIFNYGHTMSYLRLRLAGNSINPDVPVVGIAILNVGSIKFNVNEAGLVEGAVDMGGIKVNIEDGMNVGDYIYIPMAPSPILEYGNFAGIPFEFTFADGTKYTKYIQGSKTEMGKIHPISFNLQ